MKSDFAKLQTNCICSTANRENITANYDEKTETGGSCDIYHGDEREDRR